jgi:hypothetical protein
MRTVNNAPSAPVLRGNDPHKRRLAKRAASIRVSSPILPIQFEISIMRHAMPDYDSARGGSFIKDKTARLFPRTEQIRDRRYSIGIPCFSLDSAVGGHASAPPS